MPLYCKLLNIVVFIQLPKMNGAGISIRKQGGLIEHLRSKVGVLVASHGAKCPNWLPLLADLFRCCPDDNTEVEAAAHQAEVSVLLEPSDATDRITVVAEH